MDLSTIQFTTNHPLTPVYGDNVQDLLGIGALKLNPSAIIIVNSTADVVDDNDGVTTLREAINQANSDPGVDLIVFERSLFSNQQTITLTLGELDISHNVDIIAPRDELIGSDLLTVSGNKASRVFEIESGATVTLSGLIVADGSVTDDIGGGGIKNSGRLTLESSIVSNNNAGAANVGLFTSGYGGGIYNTGNLLVNNSTVNGNLAYEYAGGIYNTGTLEVNNSTISRNSAVLFDVGGIDNTGTLKVNNSTISGNLAARGGAGRTGGINNSGTLEVNNSTISGNIAFFGAGGIFNSGISTVSNSTISGNSANVGAGGISNSGISTVSNSTISGNSANVGSGGISNSGTIRVDNSAISSNSGGDGGISNSGNSTVSNSTISSNSANVGAGGISNSGTIRVDNSTISSNSGRKGGGIYNGYSGTVTLLFSTVTQNIASNGGGVYQEDVSPSGSISRGSFNVRNTIIAANLNSNPGVNPDVSGTFTSNGYNLIGDATGSTGFDATGDIVGTSDHPIDPRLAAPDYNGGPTQTIALLPDSPAIDAADPTILDTDPTTDQRGFPRVRGAYADIGAFEF